LKGGAIAARLILGNEQQACLSIGSKRAGAIESSRL